MAAQPSQRRILLLDIMDTVVHDPFFKEMPEFFNITFSELLKDKHPTAWVEFENSKIDEHTLFKKFFADGRSFNGEELRQMMIGSYRYLDGMEALLQRLHARGIEMHAVSNYPIWYRYIEDKLKLSQYLQWTFISCEGPMQGFRKPSPEAFQQVINTLQVPPEQLIFVDDRKVNVEVRMEGHHCEPYPLFEWISDVM